MLFSDYPGRRPRRGYKEPGTGLFDLVASGLAYALDRWESRNVDAELAHCREMMANQQQHVVALTNSNFNLQQRILQLQAQNYRFATTLEANGLLDTSDEEGHDQNSTPGGDSEEDE